MTARQVMVASEGFSRPLGSMSVARSELLSLMREGLLQRQEIPRVGPGECERLYYLSRRAKRVVPELDDLSRNASVFRPVSHSQIEHTLGIGGFLSLLHRDVARVQGRARLLRVLRDRELSIRVDARRYGLEDGRVIPDGTVLLELDGQVQLLFLELMNRGAVIRPGIPASVARSFAAKLWRYKALVKNLSECAELRGLVAQHRVPLPPGFRVLVVSTRGADHVEHLREAARDFKTLCYFSNMASLTRSQSVLIAPDWILPGGTHRAIVD